MDAGLKCLGVDLVPLRTALEVADGGQSVRHSQSDVIKAAWATLFPMRNLLLAVALCKLFEAWRPHLGDM